MKWSLKVGQFAGIGVYIHWSFLLLIGWLVFVSTRRGESAAEVVENIAFVMAIFGCVVLHEFGHALAARRYGIRTRDITLLPIGGLARLEGIPEEPLRELWIAVAGPLVNVGIAAMLFVVLLLAGTLADAMSVSALGGDFVARLMWVNVVLVVFNMIPAFPMDGGRVLRALLAMSIDYVRATEIAAGVARLVALGFGVLGLYWSPFLILIAVFVYMGAGSEAQAAAFRAATRGLTVGHCMLRGFRSLALDDTVGHAADLLLAGGQHDFPVVEDGRLVGMLTHGALVRALGESGVGARVADFASGEFVTLTESESLQAALVLMNQRGRTSAVVLRDGEPVGLLTVANIGEVVMLQSALRRSHQPDSLSEVLSPR